MGISDIREAFLQGGEDQGRTLLQEVLRGWVRAGLWESMQAEVEALCGPAINLRRVRLIAGQAADRGCFTGEGREPVRRPRVRHGEEGGAKLPVYEAASSQRGMFEKVVELVGEGPGLHAMGWVMEESACTSAAWRMWEEKSREQLALLRGRPLDTAFWLALVVDGVWG